jgi:Pyruvate/2-oxoacid:ferredoxin oxidoreductase gamma subunit
VVPLPAAHIANDLGRMTVKNIVALGALAGATRLFPAETFLLAIREVLHGKSSLLPLNEQAFAAGRAAALAAARR